MAIEIIPINGKSKFIDYQKFEEQIEQKIGKYCQDCKVYILNNPPTIISDIDVLLLISIENEKGNFYIPKSDDDGKPIYFHNQIIPIKFITDYKEVDKIYIENDIIYTKEEDLDFRQDIMNVTYHLKDYLQKKIYFDEEEHPNKEVYINPIFFIQNDEYKKCNINNIIINNCFDFDILHQYFKENSQKIFISNKEWFSFITFDNDVKRIIEQMSNDSESGFLTKKKIDGLSKRFSNITKLRDEIGNSPISIKGKAGTGKTNLLLGIAEYSLRKRHSITFLTYNKLLVYDISLQLLSLERKWKEQEGNYKWGKIRVDTLQKYFYDLSKYFNVSLLMSDRRYEELITILENNIDKVYNIIKEIKNPYKDLKTYFQNNTELSDTEKGYALDFIKNIDLMDLEKYKNTYIELKKKFLSNQLHKEVFITDYEEVLKNLYKAISDTSGFYTEFYIEDKGEHFPVPYIGKDKDKDKWKQNQENNIITEKGFKEYVNRKIGGLRSRSNNLSRLLIVDEAQDCLNIEKDILVHIFGEQNVIIANGGKEQLIRSGQECNWRFRNYKFKEHTLKNISHRNKKEIIDFCNFIGRAGGVNLDLQYMNSEDQGEIIFDFRKNINDNDVESLFEQLESKGKVSGCKNYESILTLISPQNEEHETDEATDNKKEKIESFIKIENNVIIENKILKKEGNWEYLKVLENAGFILYNGTKQKSPITSFDDIRIIHYESCRGLEAWSVCCFSLDYHYSTKYNDKNSENHLLNELYDDFGNILDREKRKNIYATKQILLPLTRAIDTLYIQVDDVNSYMGRIIEKYILWNKNNPNIKVLR